MGVNPDIMVRTQIELRTACIYGMQFDEDYGVAYLAKNIGWVPDKEYLKLVGYKDIMGFWPANLKELNSAAVKNGLQKLFPQPIGFGVESKLFSAQWTEEIYSKIKPCPL